MADRDSIIEGSTRQKSKRLLCFISHLQWNILKQNSFEHVIVK